MKTPLIRRQHQQNDGENGVDRADHGVSPSKFNYRNPANVIACIVVIAGAVIVWKITMQADRYMTVTDDVLSPVAIGDRSSKVSTRCGTPDDVSTMDDASSHYSVWTYRPRPDVPVDCAGRLGFVGGVLERKYSSSY